jgi:hypothetical protein
MENYACILRFESMEKIHDFSGSIVGQLGSAHEGASNQFIHSWRPRSHRRFSTRDEDQHDPPIPRGISYLAATVVALRVTAGQLVFEMM